MDATPPSTETPPTALAPPLDEKARRIMVRRLFAGTHVKLRQTRLGTFDGSFGWLKANQPDLIVVIDQAEAIVDTTALDYIEGRAADDVAFRAAGKAWFIAWKMAASALPAEDAAIPRPQSPPESAEPSAEPCTECGRTDWITTVVMSDGSRLCRKCLGGDKSGTVDSARIAGT